ncbi:MAG: RNA-binding transcriptional accessory protein [Bacteroidia bacterium]|nr:RNA-binding transcriptional accessory protein [Bacteroidia bacterium]
MEQRIAELLGLKPWQVKAVLDLISEGATVPFMARYRKEKTGNLDEVEIGKIKDEAERIDVLQKRKQTVLEKIEELGKLTPELRKSIEACTEISQVEDLYLPYKARRKTRADVAREKGLEPLAKELFDQKNQRILNQLDQFLNDQVTSEEEALAGARDIIAEWINEDAEIRASLRDLFENQATISSKAARGKKDDAEAQKFRDYFEYSEPLRRCPSHRFLAMNRGVDLGFLKVSVEPEEERAIALLKRKFLKGYSELTDQVKLAMNDAYSRLLQPSLENEMLSLFKEKSDEDAISVFALNAQQLLLASPVGQKAMMALDPGFRTGCKLVCLSATGDLVFNSTIYPHEPQREVVKSKQILFDAIKKYYVEAIAIGNGTAGRETLSFVNDALSEAKMTQDISVYMVNEAGASIYSASEAAREEFPNQDVTVRGAISIGRRLMDPLAELVKIDPKSIGVGQYQHDVNQTLLSKRLQSVVESAVNKVGVNLNTASKHLLSYVSGLGPSLAQNIVNYRKENGAFKSRLELKKVPRLGDKAFEQCAGFLRVRDGKNPLDNSSVHPERYAVIEQMSKDLGVKVHDLIGREELIEKIEAKNYVNEKESLGLLTLQDILQELKKPGLDPRGEAQNIVFEDGVKSINDLEIGMELNGIVTNVTNFGAFVDIGVKQDGLVHISQLSKQFIKHPSEAVSLGQQLKVRVTEVDLQRKRIGLTAKF